MFNIDFSMLFHLVGITYYILGIIDRGNKKEKK